MAAPEGVDDADSSVSSLAAKLRSMLVEGALILVYMVIATAVAFASMFVAGYGLTKVMAIYDLDWSTPEGGIFTLFAMGVVVLVFLHVRQFIDWFAEYYLGIETIEPRRQYTDSDSK